MWAGWKEPVERRTCGSRRRWAGGKPGPTELEEGTRTQTKPAAVVLLPWSCSLSLRAGARDVGMGWVASRIPRMRKLRPEARGLVRRHRADLTG